MPYGSANAAIKEELKNHSEGQKLSKGSLKRLKTIEEGDAKELHRYIQTLKATTKHVDNLNRTLKSSVDDKRTGAFAANTAAQLVAKPLLKTITSATVNAVGVSTLYPHASLPISFAINSVIDKVFDKIKIDNAPEISRTTERIEHDSRNLPGKIKDAILPQTNSELEKRRNEKVINKGYNQAIDTGLSLAGLPALPGSVPFTSIQNTLTDLEKHREGVSSEDIKQAKILLQGLKNELEFINLQADKIYESSLNDKSIVKTAKGNTFGLPLLDLNMKGSYSQKEFNIEFKKAQEQINLLEGMLSVEPSEWKQYSLKSTSSDKAFPTRPNTKETHIGYYDYSDTSSMKPTELQELALSQLLTKNTHSD